MTLDSTAPTLSPRSARSIESRFREWGAWLRLRVGDIATQEDHYRSLHRSRLVALRAVGIPLAIIRRNHLDDPLLDDRDWQARFAHALDRQRRRAPRGSLGGSRKAEEERHHEHEKYLRHLARQQKETSHASGY